LLPDLDKIMIYSCTKPIIGLRNVKMRSLVSVTALLLAVVVVAVVVLHGPVEVVLGGLAHERRSNK
jgi:hypothetical protein